MRGKKKRSQLNVRKDTKDALDSIKHPGQCYDGIIRELVRLYQETQKKAL